MDAMSPRMQQVFEEEKYVARLKEHMPDKFREMCFMHLSFILNLSDDKLERILSCDEKNSTRRRLALVNPIFKKKEKNVGALFGNPLTFESIRLIAPFIKWLSVKENLCKEGLFRKVGNRQRMRSLRETLLETGSGLVIDTSVYNSHDVCGVFKEFLRELPEPLLTERHMEAHMQIAVLGSHAQTPEECARYTHKKISALQLLMQLLPGATQQMVMQVLTLLHNISAIPETRMTPDTLATIFAPIFFLNKKASPVDMCDIIKVVEPTLSFMISNVHKMFKVPRELVVDIKTYCKSIEGCDSETTSPDPVKVSQAYKIRKSISGRTLNTAVCYIDREQAKTLDSTSTTQSELENLFAHINSLPDTPSNRRYKEMVSRASCTPDSSAKAHRRSKSISASLKKHLPSLSKPKAKSFDAPTQGNGTPYCDKMRIKVGHHRVSSYSKVMVVNCSPAQKQTQNLQLVDTGKKGSLDTTAMFQLLHSSGLRLSETTRTIAESMVMFTSSPSQAQAKSFQRRKRRSSGEINSFECTSPKQDCPDHYVNKLSSLVSPTTCDKSDKELSTPSSFMQKESPKSISKLPCSEMKENSLNIPTPEEMKGKISYTAAAVVPDSENEITYLPFQPINKNLNYTPSPEHGNHVQSVKARRPLRPCNAPGTPVMPRILLQMTQSIAMETSI